MAIEAGVPARLGAAGAGTSDAMAGSVAIGTVDGNAGNATFG